MITVICPCYNVEKYIDKTINSLLSQQRNNFTYEIIFVNDGSTDQTLDLLNNAINIFKNKDINVRVIDQFNAGAGAARNNAIKLATNEYIAFLDADDIWKENKLQVCYDFILKNKNCNLFSHNEKYIRLDGLNTLIKNGNFNFWVPFTKCRYDIDDEER
mgnify:CR=1 FL=1